MNLIVVVDRKIIDIKIYKFSNYIKSKILILFHNQPHYLKKLNFPYSCRILYLSFSKTF